VWVPSAFKVEHAPCKDLPPVAKERASQRLDERERVRAMAMIWNTALLKIGAA
jgi:hypothetical protein